MPCETNMRTLWILTVANTKMFMRNKQALFFTFFTPLIIMTVFGVIGFDKAAKIDVGLALDAPPTAGTKAFVEQLKQVPAFTIHEDTAEAERAAIDNGDRSVVLLVPSDLIPDQPQANAPKNIIALTNDGQQQQAATVVSIVNQILDKTTLSIAQAPVLFNLVTQTVNASNLKYIDFLLPGLVALSIMQMSVFSVAFVFANYKEKGVLKRLLATPMRPIQFVASNVITRLIVTVLQTFALIAIGVWVFHAQVVGSYFLVLLVAILGAIMFLGLGFTISGIASSVESVPAIAIFVVYPTLFFGGAFFDISTMPTWLQHIARVLPLTFFSDALREIMTKSAGLGDVAHDLLWMLVWCVVLVFAANITFGFEEKRQ